MDILRGDVIEQHYNYYPFAIQVQRKKHADASLTTEAISEKKYNIKARPGCQFY